MAETAEGTPAPQTMKQAFEHVEKTMSDAAAKDLPSGDEQATPPVTDSKDRQETKPTTEGQPVDKTKAKPQPTEAEAGQMRLADYTRKTQELARDREELKGHSQFFEEWSPTAVAYSRATPQVQAQVKALLEGSSKPSKTTAQPPSERIQKLVESFAEGDRQTVKDIFEVMLEEAGAIAESKYGELDRKIDARSKEIAQESEIRQQRDAQNEFAVFDRECPEWRDLTPRQLAWFQSEITADPNIDPIQHFKEVFLPELGSRGKKEATETANKLMSRAGQATLRTNGASARTAEKAPSNLREALEVTAAKMGWK